MNTHSLDAKDLVCPLPVLRARKVMKELAVGDILVVEATDPSSVRDFPAFCQTSGHHLLLAEDREGVFTFRIKKTG